MTKHCQVYMRHFDIGEQDLITCEACLKQGRIDGQGFDIHHINGRSSKDKDDIKNLICLCRKHHEMAHSSKHYVSKDEFQLIHRYFLQGHRKVFLK